LCSGPSLVGRWNFFEQRYQQRIERQRSINLIAAAPIFVFLTLRVWRRSFICKVDGRRNLDPLALKGTGAFPSRLVPFESEAWSLLDLTDRVLS
jgi:hypothetical protein